MEKNKKMGLASIVFFTVLIVFLFFFQKKEERYTATFLDVFDTRTDIIWYGTSEEKFVEQVSLLKEKLEYYHQLYDIYHDYEELNNIKTINDNAGVAPVKVSQEIIDLLLLSQEMYEKTNGKMNIAMGSVLKLWHEYREAGSENPEYASLPPMEQLKEAALHCEMSQLIIDEAASTVYLADEKMSLDVGSIGKGYAVQCVADYAKEIGMEQFLLSVGGNVCAVGTKPDGSSWRVGIQNPDLSSDEAYVQNVDLSDVCVVTSGNYQRYYEVDGVKYCHIINEETLMPADYAASVSIITKDSGVADALSTSVFNMPLEEGMAFVNALDDTEAMWILQDGTIQYSEGFFKYTK